MPDDYNGKVVATLVRRMQPETDRAVLYVHGYNDYFFQSQMADSLNSWGVNFYAVDLRKYGRSLLPGQTPFEVYELEEYFAGHRKIFDIPVVFTGSEFQCTVWEELMKIPYGRTISYGELARRIHNPKAVRAVASANATNPISILVPCHRVIGSNHKLTGYGGGLDAKKGLLELECSNTEGIELW